MTEVAACCRRRLTGPRVPAFDPKPTVVSVGFAATYRRFAPTDLLADRAGQALMQIGVGIRPGWPSVKYDSHTINNGLFEIFAPGNITRVVHRRNGTN